MNRAGDPLPHCKIKRNYSCARCPFFTQNPRAHLAHLRDAHRERVSIYDCPSCVYASRHYQKLVRHVRMVHGDASPAPAPAAPPAAPVPPPDTATFFPCGKCNYVTHIRARFTKHVKYHSMPMIKCHLCDFRTPYKWNLDRHMKNHGGAGSFCCSVCNFTADIKQSLTVHEMNHHAPPAGRPARRRPRAPPHQDTGNSLQLEDSEMASIKMINSDGNCYTEHSLKFDDNAMELDDFIPKLACKSCDFETMNEMELSSHEHIHNNNKQSKKMMRPIPNLIPLLPTAQSTPKISLEPPLKKFKTNTDLEIGINNSHTNLSSTNLSILDHKTESLQGNTTTVSPVKENIPKKKSESFFDKLKERLLTAKGEDDTLTCKGCGFESKCLSEHSVHEKNCNANATKATPNLLSKSLSSTRCQNCRHRCKSSADLYIHMQTCKPSNDHGNCTIQLNSDKNTESDGTSLKQEEESCGETDSQQPHPMENVVFVWNTLSQNGQSPRNDVTDTSINDDSSIADLSIKSYDLENVDALHNTETPSPTHSSLKRVYKCPHCPFCASTASRFHVHIVGHLNKKPFECSLCNYRSNWRWDITKHIRLKAVRSPEHSKAKVLMTDETGRRNYSKYNKYLSMLTPAMTESHTIKHSDSQENTEEEDSRPLPSTAQTGDNIRKPIMTILPLTLTTTKLQVPPLAPFSDDTKKGKKTLWKCKKCFYRNPSKEALLIHVREHSKMPSLSPLEKKPVAEKETKPVSNSKEAETPPAALAYRCGHCNQFSNWKHVIQRHCRLKHNGVIKVIPTERPQRPPTPPAAPAIFETCPTCPFNTDDKKMFKAHMAQHVPSSQSIFKCYFCPYFVKTETDLMSHLSLHGITEPEDYVSKIMDSKLPPNEPAPVKRHKCTECPYETKSRSQFTYHEQFHKLPPNTPYKCQVCNYSVTKRHLLHQHMKVHGVNIPKKDEVASQNRDMMEASSVTAQTTNGYVENLDELPYVWVSAKNEFHKMYKCRYCSYVNSQQAKVPNHEKMHCILFDNDTTLYKCLECKFTCDNPERLTSHSKIHGEIYGRIYCPVDTNVADDEQIKNLRQVLEEEKASLLEYETGNKKESGTETESGTGDKQLEVTKLMLYFCVKCPARFFLASEWDMHNKFHQLRFPHKCQICSYTVPQKSQLASHKYVHTEDYQSKTKMLQSLHEAHRDYQPPKIVLVVSGMNIVEPVFIAVTEPSTESTKACEDNIKKLGEITPTRPQSKQYSCEQCPAKFFKTAALNYHVGLHGGDGNYKCKKCNYAVKTIGNLVKHEMVHKSDSLDPSEYNSSEECNYKNVPLSGTDLFQCKTAAEKRVKSDKLIMRPNDHFPPVLHADPQFGYLMHGNPDFIYPTYLKNGRQKEKRYKCHKCPSAFEKREQYKVHLSLHGSKQRYKCEMCDYSVKYYANYVQHMRKHQMNADAQAARKQNDASETQSPTPNEDDTVNIKLAIKSVPKINKCANSQFSIGDQQTLKILQRRRSTSLANNKDPPPEEKRVFTCLYCPYVNQRRDSMENHQRRHKDMSGLDNSYNCVHCDFSVPQSHFLRDHLKVHFNHQRHQTPECYVKNVGLGIVITRNNGEEIKYNICDTEEENVENDTVTKVFVNPMTGEIVDETVS